MDALVAAALDAARGEMPRVVIVPTAVARHRPELAVDHGHRAFGAAAARSGRTIDVAAVPLLDRANAEHAASDHIDRLASAHLIHLPGGDPDLIPAVLRGTPAWEAVLQAVAAGACLAGASAGAMALAERLWTASGPMDGLSLVTGHAVLPHFTPERLGTWRGVVDPDRRLHWIGIDEQTLVIGRPGSTWRVAGRGSVHIFGPRSDAPLVRARAGEAIELA